MQAAPTNRQDEEEAERQRGKKRTPAVKDSGPQLPFKALPLINTWDDTYGGRLVIRTSKPTKPMVICLGDVRSRASPMDHYNDPEVMYGMVTPDRPWLLSPPDIPVGATEQDADEVKVMVYRKRKRVAATLKRSKNENKEVVNVKPAEPEPDAEDDDAPAAEEAPLKAEVAGAPAAISEKASTEPTRAVVLKSASDPAVKDRADAFLGKETAGEKAPHPQAGSTESQKPPKRDLDNDPGAKAPSLGAKKST